MSRRVCFRTICILLVSMITIMGCSNEEEIRSDQPSHVNKGQEKDLGAGQVSDANEGQGSLEIPQKISLKFSEADSAQVPHLRYTSSDVKVLQQLDHGLVIYTKDTETSEPFIGIYNEDQVLEIGTLYEEQYVPDLSVDPVEAFGEEMTAIRVICGAKCTVTYLFNEEDMNNIHIINGSMETIDLDHDGNKEVIVHTGSTIAELELYRKQDHQLEKANLNEAIQTTQGIALNRDSKAFETWIQGQQVRYTFDSKEGSLLLEQ